MKVRHFQYVEYPYRHTVKKIFFLFSSVMSSSPTRSILEIHRSPREQWKHSLSLVLEMVRMVRSFSMSGRRLLSAVRATSSQLKAQQDNSLNVAVASTKAGASGATNLMDGVAKILRRTDAGSRDETQVDVLLKSFPLLLNGAENEMSAREICQRMRIRSVPAQQILVKQGQLGREMIAVLSGSVRIIVTPEEPSELEAKDDEELEPEDWKTVPNGTLATILKPGDLFLRTARSVHLFESFALAATGRDSADDETVQLAFVDNDSYSNILMESRIHHSAALSETAVKRRRNHFRQSTRDKTTGKPKLKSFLTHAAKNAAAKKRLVTGKMQITDTISLKMKEKDRVRICISKPPERRSVEDLEFVIEYLERCGFWHKVAAVKESDEEKKQRTSKSSSNNTEDPSESRSGLTPRLQREIARNLRQIVYKKKEVVFEEKSIGTHFYYILTGSVLVRKREGTTTRHLCDLTTGSCFGELALSKHGTGKRSATIVTRELSEFLILRKDHYAESVESFQEKHLTVSKANHIFF